MRAICFEFVRILICFIGVRKCMINGIAIVEIRVNKRDGKGRCSVEVMIVVSDMAKIAKTAVTGTEKSGNLLRKRDGRIKVEAKIFCRYGELCRRQGKNYYFNGLLRASNENKFSFGGVLLFDHVTGCLVGPHPFSYCAWMVTRLECSILV